MLNPARSPFSRLSLAFGLLTLLLTFSLFMQFPTSIGPDEELSVPWQITLIRISCISGSVFALMSYLRNEKLKRLKFLGALINAIALIFIIGSMLYANTLDAAR